MERLWFEEHSGDDVELVPCRIACYRYSSLKDLISPNSDLDVCIRNHLVNQAARAYLRPMSAAPCSTAGNIFHRLWSRLTHAIGFFYRKLVWALNGTFRVVGIRNVNT